MTGIVPIYLDYNATAPLLPAALERIQAALRDYVGNPSSPHAFGQAARDALETARAGVASRLECSRRELTFTSGGSEANNTVFRAVAESPRPAHVITSPIEHPSILRCCDWLLAQGIAVSYLPVDDQGVAVVDAVEGLLRPETRLISLMAANNETGVIQPGSGWRRSCAMPRAVGRSCCTAMPCRRSAGFPCPFSPGATMP